jgi:CBS domain-containing protein
LARVRAHLLNLTARQRWGDLEQSFVQLQQRLDREGDSALGKVRELTHTVQEFIWRHLPPMARLDTPVSEVMSRRVRTCFLDDTLNVPAQIMWELDCGVVPVVDTEGRAIGMLTDRDICIASYTQGRALSACSVADAMSRRVFACSADDPLTRALQIMADERVHRVPVLDAEKRVAGLVALADIARQLRSADDVAMATALAKTLSAISKPRDAADAE